MADSEAWRRRLDEELRAAEPEPWFIRRARDNKAAGNQPEAAVRRSDSGYVPPPPLDDDLDGSDDDRLPFFTRGPVSAAEPDAPTPTTMGSARRWWPVLTGALVVLALAFGWLLRGLGEPAAPQVAAVSAAPDLPALVPRAALASAQSTCARPETLQGLAAVIFGQARRTGVPNAAWIERVATTATVRVDDAHVKTLDAADSITVCTGRLALRLPPVATGGTAPAPLSAIVDYTVQPAVDARGRVYRLDGADPIVRQLVALVPVETVEVAAAEPAAVAAPVAVTAPVRMPPKAAPSRPTARPGPRAVLASLPPVVAERSERTAAPVTQAAAEPPPRRACSGDLSPGEQAVCGNPALAALDSETNALFFGIVRYGDERTVRKVQKSREKFLGRRERCDDEACIAKAYRNRIEDLADFGLPRVGAGEPAEPRPRPANVMRVGETVSQLPICKGFESYRPSTPCRTVQNRRTRSAAERET